MNVLTVRAKTKIKLNKTKNSLNIRLGFLNVKYYFILFRFWGEIGPGHVFMRIIFSCVYIYRTQLFSLKKKVLQRKHTSSCPVDKADGTLAKFSFITSFSKSSLGYCFQCSGKERIASVNSRGTE